MKRIRQNRWPRQQGSQLVELALLLPIMITLALMISEGAGAIRAHIVLNNAAREGARISGLPENNCTTAQSSSWCVAGIKAVAINYAAANGITLTPGNVAVSQTVVVPGATVGLLASKVTVTYNYQLIFLPNFMGNKWSSVTLVGQALFRNFY